MMVINTFGQKKCGQTQWLNIEFEIWASVLHISVDNPNLCTLPVYKIRVLNMELTSDGEKTCHELPPSPSM